jgi:hypothetical protein
LKLLEQARAISPSDPRIRALEQRLRR